jgi:hypothetical protein
MSVPVLAVIGICPLAARKELRGGGQARYWVLLLDALRPAPDPVSGRLPSGR